MKAIISGGGTGGHIFPAIAIADAIKIKDPEAQILFVGAEGKMEMQLVPKAGYAIEGLPVRGFQRRLTWKNLLFPFRLMGSLVKASGIVRKFKPDVVIGVGGYASGPILQVAGNWNIKRVIQEQNSFAGVTNRILGKKVDKICVAYQNMDRFFPAQKLVFTGNPVRKEIYKHKISTEEAKAAMGIKNDHPTVLIFGGSLGARSLNEAIMHSVEKLRQHKDMNIIWQVGKLYYDEFKESEVAKWPNVQVLPFIEDMARAYQAAEVVVCRAGALTISELTLVKKAAILVPSPNVAEDHQTQNAMALVNEDAAILVKDVEAKETLVDRMLDLLGDRKKQEVLSNNISKLGKQDAAKTIADVIFDLIDEKSS